MKMLKKSLFLVVAAIMVLGVFTACASNREKLQEVCDEVNESKSEILDACYGVFADFELAVAGDDSLVFKYYFDAEMFEVFSQADIDEILSEGDSMFGADTSSLFQEADAEGIELNNVYVEFYVYGSNEFVGRVELKK